jgi:hypothetical protein
MGSNEPQRPRGVRSAELSALVAILAGTAVVACGGENETLFQDPPGAGHGGAPGGGAGGVSATGGGPAGGRAGAGGRGGATGGTSSGGSSGKAAAGGSGGSGGTTGGAGGDATTGGNGGAMGGTGAAGGAPGGTGGDGATGGSSAGSGGDTTTGGSSGIGGGGAVAGTGDGGSTMGGTAGSGAGAGKGGNAGKGGKADCQELLALASEALAEAQVCNLAVNALQCTGTVQDLCGCHVPVNDADSNATRKYLAALEAAKDCPVACTAVVCIDPVFVTCVRTTAGSSSGRCREAVAAL